MFIRVYVKNEDGYGIIMLNIVAWILNCRKIGKDISVPGRGGPWCCERSRVPHYLDKRLTDGGKVVSPTRLPPFTPRFLF
jgi:hypothetical protein